MIERLRKRFQRERQLRALVADLMAENEALKRQRDELTALVDSLPHEADIRLVRVAQSGYWRAIFGFNHGTFYGGGKSIHQALETALHSAKASEARRSA